MRLLPDEVAELPRPRRGARRRMAWWLSIAFAAAAVAWIAVFVVLARLLASPGGFHVR